MFQLLDNSITNFQVMVVPTSPIEIFSLATQE